MGLVATALSTVSTIVPLYAVARSADVATVGLFVALPNVFPVSFARPAGRAVDRRGALHWLLLGVVIDLAGFRAAFVVVSLSLASARLLIVLLRRWGQRAAARGPGSAATGRWSLLANAGVQLAVLSSASVFVAIAVRHAFLRCTC
jgi:hypothetical protein